MAPEEALGGWSLHAGCGRAILLILACQELENRGWGCVEDVGLLSGQFHSEESIAGNEGCC